MRYQFIVAVVLLLFFAVPTVTNQRVHADCNGQNCSSLECTWNAHYNGVPCTQNGGCCAQLTPGAALTCLDPDPPVGTPFPTSSCIVPTQPAQGDTPTEAAVPTPNTETETPIVNTPTLAPCENSNDCSGDYDCRCRAELSQLVGCTQKYCYPGGNLCTIGGNTCAADKTCRCSQRPDDIYCNIGRCYQGYVNCEVLQRTNTRVPCSTNSDCARNCGDPEAICNDGICDVELQSNIAPCQGAGMSCMPLDQCRDNVSVCGEINRSLTCSVDGEVCCTPRQCPPVQVGERFKYAPCPDDENGILTGLGCIPTDATGFIQRILTIGIGLGGGIAFLLILLGGFKVIMSQGNPEAMNEGRDLITSAIAGLMLIIFSVFILRFIGVNILSLPGFG